MLIDEEKLKLLIKETVIEAINSKDEQKYYGFTDVKKFNEISGISKNDIEKKLMTNPEFAKHVYQFDEGNKRYIDMKPALDAVAKILGTIYR